MSRYRHLIVTLGVVAVLLLSFGAATAKGNDTPKPPHGGTGQPPTGEGKPAHLTWVPRRIMQAVTAGQTIQLTATFTSSADIAEATLVIPGALGRVLKADTARFSNIKAGVLTTVRFTATLPAQVHTLGGVVQVRAGLRMLGEPLPVLLTAANRNDAGGDDTPKPKPAHPKPAHP